MKAASEFLRRHRCYSCRLLVPLVLSSPSCSPSNFSSTIPFHRRNFAANPYHTSSASPLFSNYVAYRAFSWFTWRDSVEIVKREGDFSATSQGKLEVSPIEVLETVSEPPSLSSDASYQISEDVFGDNTWYHYPIQAVISMLDGFHDFTGLPWWVHLCLKNPTVRNQLGLPNLMDPKNKRVSTEKVQLTSAPASEILIPIEAVPPKMLLELAFKDMEAGDQDKALILLRKAIEKDPELAQALVAIGQILCSKKLFEEAAENFEIAIPKLSYTKEEEIGLLVLSLFGAGVSRIWQGRNSDGIEHLKKMAELREPDSPMDKACYYRGLVMLGSTLFQLGEKSEAAKYLQIAATYDPGVNAYVKECEEG